MKDSWRKNYLLDDETASSLWESVGLFVRAQNREGDDGITSVIVKSIFDESRAQSVVAEVDDIPEKPQGLERFLSELDARFHGQKAVDLIEEKDYSGAIEIWKAVICSEYFDPRHPFYHDKPYYRAQVTSGICQVLLALIQGINSGQATQAEISESVEATLRKWVERTLTLAERIVDSDPFSDSSDGYFKSYTEGASAQNHNVWVCLNTMCQWFNGWSPMVLEVYSQRPISEIEKIIEGIVRTELSFRASDRH